VNVDLSKENFCFLTNFDSNFYDKKI